MPTCREKRILGQSQKAAGESAKAMKPERNFWGQRLLYSQCECGEERGMKCHCLSLQAELCWKGISVIPCKTRRAVRKLLFGRSHGNAAYRGKSDWWARADGGWKNKGRSNRNPLSNLRRAGRKVNWTAAQQGKAFKTNDAVLEHLEPQSR